MTVTYKLLSIAYSETCLKRTPSGNAVVSCLIQGVRLIEVSIDNVIWGVKCHSNEQEKRLEYSQRLRQNTFAWISLSNWTNWSYYLKHRLQLKFEEIRWVKKALYKQNEIENKTSLTFCRGSWVEGRGYHVEGNFFFNFFFLEKNVLLLLLLLFN